MIQMQTVLQPADNSGAKKLQCIKVLGGSKRKYASVGDIIVVGDLIRQGDESLSLLDYALNLSPALRDTITRDVAQNVSAFEPRLRRKTPPQARSLLGRSTTPEQAPDPLEGSVQSKASYLLKPPKAPIPSG